MKDKIIRLLCFSIIICGLFIPSNLAQDEPLISRKVLFGNPDKASLKN